jgi:hypothetical protein
VRVALVGKRARALDFTVPGLLSEQSIAAGGAPMAVPDPREW